MIDMNIVKAVRERTGLSLALAAKAVAAGKDLDGSLEWLRKNSPKVKVEDPTDPSAEGRIATYVHHNGQLGAMIYLACKTDFTARTSEFEELAKEIAMHVAASNPKWIAADLIDPLTRAEIITQIEEQTAAEGVPEFRRDQVNQGRLAAYFRGTVLLLQPSTREPRLTIGQLIQRLSDKVGEPITVRHMARFKVGDLNTA